MVDLLMVVALIGIITTFALPVTGSAVAAQRFKTDSEAVAQMVGVAKMRASARFTRARLRANLGDRTFVLELWNTATGVWVPEGTPISLAQGIAFGFGGLSAPPPNTQPELAQSPACRIGTTADSDTIENTACIVFNSRGLPVDGAGLLFGGHALYITDGASTGGTTITATPRIRRWLARTSSATWKEQQ